MILGLLPLTEGKIMLDGINISRYNPTRRFECGLSYLPQETSLFGDLSVFDNLYCVLEGRRPFLKKDDKIQRINELIEQVGLEKDSYRLARYLSGGQKRRLEFARLLATEPKYVLLDEPFAGVDPKSIKDIQQQILALRAHSIGILISDHNVDAILSICDKAHVLIGGRILSSGSPAELRANKVVQEYYLAS
jgi:lipopolysaccharide export system ATP-binding protein